MERKDFFEKAQKVSYLCGLGAKIQEIPDDVLCKYRDVIYYPVGCAVKFDEKGQPYYLAMLKEVKSGCNMSCPLEQVQDLTNE